MNQPRSLDFAAPDLPLRDDVRRLGALVGDMLSEQVSADFLEKVELVVELLQLFLKKWQFVFILQD